MAHKHSLKALHKTMRDLNGNYKQLGGAISLSDDFRRILPFIPRPTYPGKINAYSNQLFLWQSFEIDHQHASTITK